MSKLLRRGSGYYRCVVVLGGLWGALGCGSSDGNPTAAISNGGALATQGGTAGVGGNTSVTTRGGAASDSAGGQSASSGAGSSNALGGSTGVVGGNGSGGNSTNGGSNRGGGSWGGAIGSGGANLGGVLNAGGSSSVGGRSALGGAAMGGAALGGAATGGQARGGATSNGGATATGGAQASGGGSTGGIRATGGNVSAAGGAANLGGNSGTPGVRIVGRTVKGSAGTKFSWPGVNISASFTGTQIAMQLNDGSNGNTFEVVVDGGTPRKITTTSGQTTIQLASGLGAGTHQLLIWRNTEPSYGISEFVGLTGFSAGGALLAPPAAPDRRIEVIGDSISCGAGIEGSGSCSTTKDNENHYYSYGAVAARALGADLHTIAWSGIGMYRNYNENGPSANAMPARYPYAIPSDTSTTWDFSQYQPQAVVINLTSNDFSTKGDPGQPYVDAYVNFVKMLRTKYASAQIFAVIEWSTSATAINNIVSNLRAAGDSKVSAFDIRPSAGGSGCSGHPNVAQSAAMGNALATEMKRVLGW